MSDQPISKSADKFAKAEADKHSTTIGIEGEKPEGGPGEATLSVNSQHEGKHVSWSVGAWIRRKFTRGGSSVGGKGEIKF